MTVLKLYFKIIIAYLILSLVLLGALDNNLTFKFYYKSIRSYIKTNSTLLKLVNKNLLSNLTNTEATHAGTMSL